jgi:hypothetical protein
MFNIILYVSSIGAVANTASPQPAYDGAALIRAAAAVWWTRKRDDGGLGFSALYYLWIAKLILISDLATQ